MRRMVWWGAVGSGLAVANAAGRGALGVATPWSWSGWTMAERSWGPVVVAMSVLRLGVIAAGIYLAVLLVLAELARVPVAGRYVLRLLAAIPVGRLVATQLVGAFVAVGAVGPAFADPAPVMHVMSTPTTTSVPGVAAVPPVPATAIAPVLPPAPAVTEPATPAMPGAPTVTPAATGSSAPAPTVAVPVGAAPTVAGPTVPAPTVAAPSNAPTTVVLGRGDSLWSAAEHHLQAVLGRTPVEAEVGAYWWRVVEANRSRLIDPADPNFVLPNFVVMLPAVG